MASRESTKWQQTLQSHYKGKGTVGYCWLVSGRFFTSNTDFLFMNKSSYKLNILDPDPSIKQISQPFVIPHHSFLFGIFFFLSMQLPALTLSQTHSGWSDTNLVPGLTVSLSICSHLSQVLFMMREESLWMTPS